MSRSMKVLGFLLVTMVGAYGCAKGPGAATPAEGATAAAKAQKLESDYRAAVAARDQFRQKLAAAEEQHARAQMQWQQQIEQVRATAAAEKDVLRGEVKARTGERDAIIVQFEAFRKNLRDLIGTADSAVGALNLPAADQGVSRN